MAIHIDEAVPGPATDEAPAARRGRGGVGRAVVEVVLLSALAVAMLERSWLRVKATVIEPAFAGPGPLGERVDRYAATLEAMLAREREERNDARRLDEWRPHPNDCLCRTCAQTETHEKER